MDPPWQLASSNPTRGVRAWEISLSTAAWSHSVVGTMLQVAIGYQQLGDNLIQDIPIAEVQDSGLMFMWVINAKYRFAINMLEKWGYKYDGLFAMCCVCTSLLCPISALGPVLGGDRLIDELAWVKQTVNRRLAKSHGYYLQHAKETCLIALKVHYQCLCWPVARVPCC